MLCVCRDHIFEYVRAVPRVLETQLSAVFVCGSVCVCCVCGKPTEYDCKKKSMVFVCFLCMCVSDHVCEYVRAGPSASVTAVL